MSTNSYPNNERVPISARSLEEHADAGWRVFSFLNIETDAGHIGWSEYNESYGSKGLIIVIMKLTEKWRSLISLSSSDEV